MSAMCFKLQSPVLLQSRLLKAEEIISCSFNNFHLLAQHLLIEILTSTLHSVMHMVGFQETHVGLMNSSVPIAQEDGTKMSSLLHSRACFWIHSCVRNKKTSLGKVDWPHPL